MNIEYKWFDFQLEDQQITDVKKKISKKWQITENGYKDSQNRIVKIKNNLISIGIPLSNIVDEQEQLEFITAFLGIDIF